MAEFFPKIEEFSTLYRKDRLVPVYRQLLADTHTPVSALAAIETGDWAFLLESVEGGEKIGRYSFLGADPRFIFKSSLSEVEIISRDGKGAFTERRTYESENPFDELRKHVETFAPVEYGDLPRFSAGAVGYIGYDAVRLIEHLPDMPEDVLGVPDLYFMFFDTMLIFDHVNKTMKIIAYADCNEGDADAVYAAACRRIDAVTERLMQGVVSIVDDIDPKSGRDIECTSNFNKEDYEAAVAAAKEYIKAGDIFQVVLSQRLNAKTSARAFDIYRALRVVNPSPYMFYLKFEDMHVVGSSPEVMVRVEDERITLRPIAGTRWRGRTPEEDRALAEELLADPKERAEHIMLLDLGRNDVGRVAEYGTVNIDENMVIEYYSHVMHIVSNVSGTLRKGMGAFDTLQSCLPAGTVSGAPKVRAMEIIDELEPEKRGPYAGAVGYFDFHGNLDTCITIRTIVMKDGDVYVQAGGGVVADSVPENEFNESMNKARALLKAIAIAEESFGA